MGVESLKGQWCEMVFGFNITIRYGKKGSKIVFMVDHYGGCLWYTKLFQNTRQESLIHGEDAKIRKTENISVNNGPTGNFFRSFLALPDWLD
jgi:hypothetical protein